MEVPCFGGPVLWTLRVLEVPYFGRSVFWRFRVLDVSCFGGSVFWRFRVFCDVRIENLNVLNDEFQTLNVWDVLPVTSLICETPVH